MASRLWLIFMMFIGSISREKNVKEHWEAGNNICKKKGSYLVSIHSEQDDIKVQEYCRGLGGICWIGLQAESCKHAGDTWYSGFDRVWTRADGTTFLHNDVNAYSNWCDGYPQNSSRVPEWGYCAGGKHVLYDVDGGCWKNSWDGLWDVHVDPQYTQKFICHDEVYPNQNIQNDEEVWFNKHWDSVLILGVMSTFGACNLCILLFMYGIYRRTWENASKIYEIENSRSTTNDIENSMDNSMRYAKYEHMDPVEHGLETEGKDE